LTLRKEIENFMHSKVRKEALKRMTSDYDFETYLSEQICKIIEKRIDKLYTETKDLDSDAWIVLDKVKEILK
jgi:hypothetical protein